MFKFLFCFIPLLSPQIEVVDKELNQISLIVYSEFTNPQITYESLIEHLHQSKLVDSLTIIGRPIRLPETTIEFDTALVQRYGVSFDSLEYRIKNLRSHKDLLEQEIMNESGQKIPFSAFSTLSTTLTFYKPKTFLPLPTIHKYNGRHAVEVKIYCKHKNESELISLLKNYISTNSDEFIDEDWEIEIVK